MIHPTALIASTARLAADVEIGPYVIVEDGVEIGEGSRLAAASQILRGVRMGARNTVDRGAIIGGAPQSLSFDTAIPSGVTIGDDNSFREHVTIHRSAQPDGRTVIGSHNFLMAGVHLGHDAILGDHNVLANNVLIAGHVTIGSRCFLGGGAGFHQFIRVGDLAMAQGNSSISQDVPPYCMVNGLNILTGLNIVGLRRAGFDHAARLDLKRALQAATDSALGMVKGAAHALASREWTAAATTLLEFLSAPGPKGLASPARPRGA